MDMDKNVPTFYRPMPKSRDLYLAYVVVVCDSLNFHLDIYWPDSMAEQYKSAMSYEYTFESEELQTSPCKRNAHVCHLDGVELDTSDSNHAREAYILLTKRLFNTGGWALISVSDIDIYRRVLVVIYDALSKERINDMILNYTSPVSGTPIARNYSRPGRNRPLYKPDKSVPTDYLIVYK